MKKSGQNLIIGKCPNGGQIIGIPLDTNKSNLQANSRDLESLPSHLQVDGK